MLAITPRGFRDVLPEEARWRERIIAQVSKVCSLWGYDPIETPTLEVLEVLQQGAKLAHSPFRLFDSDNQLLVLRPDVTLPIARMTATRLKPSDLPLRLRYVQSVFCEQEQLKAQPREYTQIGIESLGLSGSCADAEVVMLFCDALRACGLKEFTVAICTVGVLRELLLACERRFGLGEDWQRDVLNACHESNLVALQMLASDSRLDHEHSQALQQMVTLNGKGDIVEKCLALVEPLGCTDGLIELARTWKLAEDMGYSENLRIDFSVMSAFDYYSGLVIEAYAPGFGVALGRGGRYDGLLSAYGKSAPAAGFAFSLEAVMQALARQGAGDELLDVGEESHLPVNFDAPVQTFLEASKLRQAGMRVILDITDVKMKAGE